MNDAVEVTKPRLEYAETLLSRLNISVEVDGVEKIDHGRQYLIISNHRSIIDPAVFFDWSDGNIAVSITRHITRNNWDKDDYISAYYPELGIVIDFTKYLA